jgi:hypothetical protein
VSRQRPGKRAGQRPTNPAACPAGTRRPCAAGASVGNRQVSERRAQDRSGAAAGPVAFASCCGEAPADKVGGPVDHPGPTLPAWRGWAMFTETPGRRPGVSLCAGRRHPYLTSHGRMADVADVEPARSRAMPSLRAGGRIPCPPPASADPLPAALPVALPGRTPAGDDRVRGAQRDRCGRSVGGLGAVRLVVGGRLTAPGTRTAATFDP